MRSTARACYSNIAHAILLRVGTQGHRAYAAWLLLLVLASSAPLLAAPPADAVPGSTITVQGEAPNDAPASSSTAQSQGAAEYLDSRGIALGGWLQFDSSRMLTGGLPQAPGYLGQYLLDLSATVDTQKFLGWTGGSFLIDVQSHRGANILGRQMLAIQDPDNMDAPANSFWVDQAWYHQGLFGEKLELQAGLMYVDAQFLTVPYGENFISLDFSSDASISTFVLPTYPKGSPGADAFFYPLPGLYLSVGAFNNHSTELPYDPGGQLFITEEGWQSIWHGHPYKLQLGRWTDTGTFERLADSTPQRRASGTYLVASAKLWQPAPSSERGLGMFLQFGTAPAALAAVQRHYGAGVVWTGLFASRPQDEIGLGVSYAALAQPGGFPYSFEKEVEAYYQFKVLGGLTVQPNLEFWQHPNGSGPDATLFLIRAQYTFGAGA